MGAVPDETQRPEPDDFVTVRYGDLVELEERLKTSQENMAQAFSDIAWILVTLGIELDEEAEVSPELATSAYIIPKIQALMVTKGLVEGAEEEIRQRAKALQLPTVDIGGGRSMTRVGGRLSDEDSAGLRKGPRRDRH